MLILTRRIMESLIVGDDIEFRILGIKGNQVRIGIDAPKEVSVHREEVYERIFGGKYDILDKQLKDLKELVEIIKEDEAGGNY